jgi:hypothetical protein
MTAFNNDNTKQPCMTNNKLYNTESMMAGDHYTARGERGAGALAKRQAFLCREAGE